MTPCMTPPGYDALPAEIEGVIEGVMTPPRFDAEEIQQTVAGVDR